MFINSIYNPTVWIDDVHDIMISKFIDVLMSEYEV